MGDLKNGGCLDDNVRIKKEAYYIGIKKIFYS
jgi:hypothetical protein